jgi:deoxyribodipyrimidine photo-lyase
MSDNLMLVWHRRDLRLSDNVSLAAARQRSRRVVGLFCLDPAILDRDDVAPARVAYLMGSLAELRHSYANAGSHLLFLQGDPVVRIVAVAKALQAAVFWNLDVEPYAQERDRAVTTALTQAGIGVHTHWDQLLHGPDEIRSGAGTPYTVYTPFWKNWVSQPKPLPVAPLQDAQGLTEAEAGLATQAGAIALPTARDLGYIWRGPWVLPPGEAAAHQQLESFTHRAIFSYQDQRNIPSDAGTSTLSPALKFGTIGIRTIWAKTVALEPELRSDEARASVQTWRQELAWREFYQHVMYLFPELAAGPYRAPFKNFPWENNPVWFEAWCAGNTGYPIVDAAMRQLNTTGWMHNRCRMIVASFLTKDLVIDWRWGEKYFMQLLVDGDLSANNGGWQWSASSGMDPKPLRIFNPASQAQKFDPEAAYIREWVPEIRSLETVELVTGKILPLDRDRLNYPQPIVDHAVQQRHFKALYQQVKGL